MYGNKEIPKEKKERKIKKEVKVWKDSLKNNKRRDKKKVRKE